jgi:hypothetical protein
LFLLTLHETVITPSSGFSCNIQTKKQVTPAVIPEQKTLFLRSYFFVATGAAKPLMPWFAATSGSLISLQLVVWSTLLREALDRDEQLGLTTTE